MATWAVGAVGPALQVADHGDNGRTAAAILLAGAATVAVGLRWGRLRGAWALVIAGLGGLVLIAETVPLVGRAPALVTLGAVVVADAALAGRRPRWWAGPDDPAAVTALGLAGLATALWAVLGALVPTGLLLLGSLAVTSSHRRSPAAWGAAERPVRRLASRAQDRTLRLLGAGAAPAVVSGVVAAAATAPIFHRLASDLDVRVLSTNDFYVHLPLAEEMAVWPPYISTAQFLFHGLTALLIPWLGAEVAASVILATAVGLTAVVLVVAAGRAGLTGWTTVLLPAGFFLTESPTVLLVAAGVVDLRSPFMPVHFYATPSQVVVLPLALATTLTLVHLLDGASTGARPRWGPLLGLAALSALTTLAHPSYMIAFGPGTVLYLAVRRSGGGARAAVVSALLVPGGAVMAWQSWFLMTGQSPTARDGFTFEPFRTIEILGLDRIGPAFATTAALVAVAAWAGGRRYPADPLVGLSLAALACALVPLFLVTETGERALDGNMGKPGFISWVLLYVATLRFTIAEALRPPGEERRRWVVALVVFAVIASGAGILAHLDALGVASVLSPEQG